MRSATIWLEGQADPPHPLIQTLMEKFALRRNDAYRVANHYNERQKGRTTARFAPVFGISQ